jgi:protein SCO1/2
MSNALRLSGVLLALTLVVAAAITSTTSATPAVASTAATSATPAAASTAATTAPRSSIAKSGATVASPAAAATAGSGASAAVAGRAAPIAGLKSGVFDPPRVAPEIALPSTIGPFKLSDYRGKLVVLEFGYTNCGNVCPVSLAQLAQARAKLGAAASDVQVLFVTVDPARDNAARLKTYLSAFDPSFIGVTGTPAQITALLSEYGISAQRLKVAGSTTDYTMHHSSYLYFIDRHGMQRALMPFGRPSAEMASDISLLLKL